VYTVVYYMTSETWPVKKENALALRWSGMIVIKWMCGSKVTDRIMCSELRETRNRLYNYNDAATEVKTVWACLTTG